MVIAGIEIHRDLAVDDDLRRLVGRRLEQHRVEIGVRRQPGGQCLQGLRAADLAAVDRHRRIERHVLRLERRHVDATALENAAQRGDQRRFSGIRGGALNHQGEAGHARHRTKRGADYRTCLRLPARLASLAPGLAPKA